MVLSYQKILKKFKITIKYWNELPIYILEWYYGTENERKVPKKSI